MDFSDLGGQPIPNPSAPAAKPVDFSDLGGEKLDQNWGDIWGNIVPDAENTFKGTSSLALRAGKGVMDLPTDAITTGLQELNGVNPMQTPLGQDVKTVGSGIVDAVKGMGRSIPAVFNKEEWINHPFQNALTVASFIDPLLEGTEGAGGLIKGLGESAERKGGNIASDLMALPGDEVKRMNPAMMPNPEAVETVGRHANPADLRTQAGIKGLNEGIVGKFGDEAGDIWPRVMQKMNEAGEQVNQALEGIKNQSKINGEYPNLTNPVYDPLHVEANPILKPLIDKSTELINSSDPEDIAEGKTWKTSYNILADKANANGGRLTFDDIHNEMQRVGNRLGKATKGSEKYNIYKAQYAHLAEIRDAMVDQVAKQSGHPELASKLLKANQNYSFYRRIINGIEDQAAGGNVGGNQRGIIRALSKGNIYEAAKHSSVIPMLESMRPAMAQKLVQTGSLMQKYGPLLESAAKRGVRNLAATDYILKNSDPEYAQAMQ